MASTFAMPGNTVFWKKNLDCISPVLEAVFCKNSLLKMTKTSHGLLIKAPYQKNKQTNKQTNSRLQTEKELQK